MFFLLRLAFWLGLVLILLPTGAGHRTAAANGLDATDAFAAASATVHDAAGFCTREPKACAVGSELASIMAERARAGARMLYDFLSRAGAPPGGAAPTKSAAIRSSQDTLTPGDLAPAWRGPSLHRNAAPPPDVPRRASFRRANGRPAIDRPGA